MSTVREHVAGEGPLGAGVDRDGDRRDRRHAAVDAAAVARRRDLGLTGVDAHARREDAGRATDRRRRESSSPDRSRVDRSSSARARRSRAPSPSEVHDRDEPAHRVTHERALAGFVDEHRARIPRQLDVRLLFERAFVEQGERMSKGARDRDRFRVGRLGEAHGLAATAVCTSRFERSFGDGRGS